MTPLVNQFYKEGHSWCELKEGLRIPQKNLEVKFNPCLSPLPLHVWMIVFGYYTITSYDKTKDEVVLNIPNLEIEEKLEYALANYDPDHNSTYDKWYNSDIQQLGLYLRNGFFEKAVKILQTFVFKRYFHPAQGGVTPQDVLRLELILRAAKIPNEVGRSLKKDKNLKEEAGDLDLLTTMHTGSLVKNYIMGLKLSNSKGKNKHKNKEEAYYNLKQLATYLKNHPKSLMDTLKNQTLIFFVGLGFETEDKSASLTSWSIVPCEHGKLRYDQVNSNSIEIITRLQKLLDQPEYAKISSRSSDGIP